MNILKVPEVDRWMKVECLASCRFAIPDGGSPVPALLGKQVYLTSVTARSPPCS